MTLRGIAVVTGASSGIGAEIARLLSRTGYRCVLIARREDRLRALAEEVDGEYEVCDVTDRNAVESTANRVLERHPALTVLVNNAGVPARATFLDGDPVPALETNYLGGVWCLRAFLPGLEAGAPSHVVNMVSVAGTATMPRAGPYSASKYAQLAFSRATAAQLRSRGILVHTVKPGFVETEGFPQSWLPGPAQRLVIGPEQVAAHVLDSIERGRGETTVPGTTRSPGSRRRSCRISSHVSCRGQDGALQSDASGGLFDPGHRRGRGVPGLPPALSAAHREDRA